MITRRGFKLSSVFFINFVMSIGIAKVCLVTLKSVNEQVQADFLTSEEKDKINLLFQATQNIDGRSAGEDAFEIYMKARLRQLPEDVRAKVAEIYKNAEIQESSGLDSYYHPLTQSLKLRGPERYKLSILDFAVRAHEVEHVIQDTLHRKEVGTSIYQSKWAWSWIEASHLKEIGAMSAEWKYLSTMPINVRRELAKRIREDQMKTPFKDALAYMLENPAMPLKEYLDQMAKSGRYSKSNLVQLKILGTITPTLITAMAGAIVGSFLFEGYCLDVINEKTIQEDWFKKYCVFPTVIEKVKELKKSSP